MSLDYEHANKVLDDLYRQSTRHVITPDEKVVLDAAIALYHADIEWREASDSEGEDWRKVMEAAHEKREEVYAAFEQAVAKIVGTA